MGDDWKWRSIVRARRVLMTETNSLFNHTLDVAKMNETQVWNVNRRSDNIFAILTYIITPITILGLISNGAIFWFLCCRIKKTKYTVYVLNLAIADFTVLFSFDMCFALSFIIWKRLAFNEYLYAALDILSIFGYNTSFFILTAISVERCLGAFYPVCYHFNRPKHLSTLLCALLWVLSCVVTGVEYFTCWSVLILDDDVPSRTYPITSIFLAMVFLLFIPVMVFCSVSLFIKIRRNSQLMSQARLYLIIVITVVLFLLFALPFRLMCLIVYWYSATAIEETLFHCSFFLHLINSSADPFVYFLVGKWRRRETLYAVLYRSCKDETEVPVPEHLGNEQDRS